MCTTCNQTSDPCIDNTSIAIYLIPGGRRAGKLSSKNAISHDRHQLWVQLRSCIFFFRYGQAPSCSSVHYHYCHWSGPCMNPRSESSIGERLSLMFPRSRVAPSLPRTKTQGDETTLEGLERSILWAGASVSADWGDAASRLWMFTYLTDPGFLATDSMEAYFRAIGPYTRILQEWQW